MASATGKRPASGDLEEIDLPWPPRRLEAKRSTRRRPMPSREGSADAASLGLDRGPDAPARIAAKPAAPGMDRPRSSALVTRRATRGLGIASKAAARRSARVLARESTAKRHAVLTSVSVPSCRHRGQLRAFSGHRSPDNQPWRRACGDREHERHRDTSGAGGETSTVPAARGVARSRRRPSGDESDGAGAECNHVSQRAARSARVCARDFESRCATSSMMRRGRASRCR